MATSNNMILNRVFTQNTFKNLISSSVDEAYSGSVEKYLDDRTCKTSKELLSEIYHIMSKKYRNEYFYKNTLLNKILIGKHSVRTTTALKEVPIARSKADIVMINGKAIVYEIKTELDNFERLDCQLDDYFKAFNHVCVVTCEANYESIKKRMTDTPVGIIVLTDRNTLSERKVATEDSSRLDMSEMFKILRKGEYEDIIKRCYGNLPQVSQFDYYKTCRSKFIELGVERAYFEFLKVLKARSRIDIELLKELPYELKFLFYFWKIKKDEYKKLNILLNEKFGG